MRRTAIVVAVMLTLVAVAPAAGAQCDPECRDVGADGLVDLDDVVQSDDVAYESPTISDSGPTLP